VKFVKPALIALSCALFGAACQTATNENSAKTPVAAATATPAAAPDKDLSTPTKAALTFYQGVRAKDVKKIEATLSQGTLAQAKEQSPEDPGKVILESVQQSAPPPAALDIRNEKINGDKATLEVGGLDEKDKNKIETFYFTKEGNDWKVDLFHEEKGEMKKDPKAEMRKENAKPAGPQNDDVPKK
jgi:hypothetical protein